MQRIGIAQYSKLHFHLCHTQVVIQIIFHPTIFQAITESLRYIFITGTPSIAFTYHANEERPGMHYFFQTDFDHLATFCIFFCDAPTQVDQ